MAPITSARLVSALSPPSVSRALNTLRTSDDVPLLGQSTYDLPADDSRGIADKVLTARQSQQTQPIIVPTTYINSRPGANSGEVVGIVLGVVFGILLILWILNSLRANPLRPVVGTSSVTDVGRYRSDRSERRSRTAKTKSSGRRTARSRSKSAVSREEMSEVQQASSRRERGHVGRSPRRARETVIVEESRRESRPPPPPEEYDDDVVEVIEEESDFSAPPRQRRPSYRNVDPDGYGGASVRSFRR